MADTETEVAVIGGGVVGCAVAHALARRGVQAQLLEAERELALGASGANSGILHSGFDSKPGELETRLILRAAVLRDELLDELGIAVWRCGAELSPSGEGERAAVRALAKNAGVNGVPVEHDDDGPLSVPGETVTDPVAFVDALAAAAGRGGATLKLGTRVTALAGTTNGAVALELADGQCLRARAAVNCAGLHADELARMAGEELVEVYPRKGEFLVFATSEQEPLERILLPVPSALGKGVLVLPTLDRRAVIAGPTAREREDKRDWSVEADARALITAKARRMLPVLEGQEPIGAYAGLRPAGRGANYVIERSRTLPTLLHVAAIRSTGLSASLAIGERAVELLADAGAITPGPVRALPPAASAATGTPPRGHVGGSWWERAMRRSDSVASPAGTR
jgi:glycerol-3-phosphate dehydrogenase